VRSPPESRECLTPISSPSNALEYPRRRRPHRLSGRGHRGRNSFQAGCQGQRSPRTAAEAPAPASGAAPPRRGWRAGAPAQARQAPRRRSGRTPPSARTACRFPVSASRFTGGRNWPGSTRAAAAGGAASNRQIHCLPSSHTDAAAPLIEMLYGCRGVSYGPPRREIALAECLPARPAPPPNIPRRRPPRAPNLRFHARRAARRESLL